MEFLFKFSRSSAKFIFALYSVFGLNILIQQFVITFIFQVETYNGEPIQLVRLRASGLSADYVGAWSKSSLEWDDVLPNEMDRLGYKELADGEFW